MRCMEEMPQLLLLPLPRFPPARVWWFVDLRAGAEEVGAERAQVDPRGASPPEVERAIHIVQARCPGPPLSDRLRAAVEKWVANGGVLQADLTEPPDLESAASVPCHKILAPTFRLASRAFMLTYNNSALCPDMWEEFQRPSFPP